MTININDLIDQKWTFYQLNEVFSNIIDLNIKERKAKEKNIVSVLEIFNQYKVAPTIKSLRIFNKPAEDWIREANLIAVENNFQAVGKIKHVRELIEELKNKNQNNKSLLNLISNDKLQQQIEQVKNTKL